MQTGAKKIIKPEKTKFRKNGEDEQKRQLKNKHHDKSYYRLLKQEKEYVV